jgi:hypothetical protein
MDPIGDVWKALVEGIGGFDKTAAIGLILLLFSFSLGLLTRNSAYITNTSVARFPACDSYLTWLCIPTKYVAIPLGSLGSLVLNLTSFISTAILFILGIVLVRNRSGDGRKSRAKPRRRGR